MASGPDPLNPLSESHVAKTVRRSTKAMNSSIKKVSAIVIPGPGTGVHKLSDADACRALRIPAPESAPSIWAITYSKALSFNTYKPCHHPRHGADNRGLNWAAFRPVSDLPPYVCDLGSRTESARSGSLCTGLGDISPTEAFYDLNAQKLIQRIPDWTTIAQIP